MLPCEMEVVPFEFCGYDGQYLSSLKEFLSGVTLSQSDSLVWLELPLIVQEQ